MIVTGDVAGRDLSEAGSAAFGDGSQRARRGPGVITFARPKDGQGADCRVSARALGARHRPLTRLKRSGIIILESDRKIALADHVALEEMAEGF